MIYAQFFQQSATNQEDLIEACGDRSVVILDGRFSGTAHRQWAREECSKRGYKAWQLMKGAQFTNAKPVGELETV